MVEIPGARKGTVVECPLPDCGQPHAVKRDRRGEPFVSCRAWMLTVWFRPDTAGGAYLARRSREDGGPMKKDSEAKTPEEGDDAY